MVETKTKTVTFNDLLEGNKRFYITYAKTGKSPKNETLDTPEDVLKFISENIYDISLLSINNVVLDIDKIIEKYSR